MKRPTSTFPQPRQIIPPLSVRNVTITVFIAAFFFCTSATAQLADSNASAATHLDLDREHNPPTDDDSLNLKKTHPLQGERQAVANNGPFSESSIDSLVNGFHSSARSLPQLMDEMLETALGSLGTAAGSMFKDDLQVSFALLKDENACVVRLHLPDNTQSPGHSAPRKVFVSVIGRQHLRVKINMTFAGLTTEMTKTIQLPFPVSKDDVDITSNADGSVHVKLRLVSDDESETGKLSDIEESVARGATEVDSLLGRIFPALFAAPPEDDTTRLRDSSQELVREMPSADEVSQCKAKFGPERLLLSKCLCDATSDGDSRAICYGSLISRCVRTARRMGRDDFATTSKHLAIECAGGSKDRVECLEGVVRDILGSLYVRGKKNGKDEDIGERIRLAIESEDDGGGEFKASAGAGFVRHLLGFLIGVVGAVVFGVVYLKVKKGKVDLSETAGKAVQLSSVMTQRSASRGGEGVGRRSRTESKRA